MERVGRVGRDEAIKQRSAIERVVRPEAAMRTKVRNEMRIVGEAVRLAAEECLRRIEL